MKLIAMRRHMLALALVSVGALISLTSFSSTSFAQGANVNTAQDPTDLITRAAYDVKVLKNGMDITAKVAPGSTIQYNKDGTAVRKTGDGKTVNLTWKFGNPQKTLLEMNSPDTGNSRWVILEVSDKMFRKANVDSGIEAVQTTVR